MQQLTGVVQHYDWGDPIFLPNLLGVEPDGQPWAELWLGTHPSAPSTFADGTPLDAVAGRLPFLLKILACERPLSLQTHPNTEQAQRGFEAGVFADPYSKPELLCALTPFRALCGLRPHTETVELLAGLGATELADVVAAEGAGAALAGLYRGTITAADTIRCCGGSDRPEARVVARLSEFYGDQPSVAATLLLNHVELAPGEALRLDAGNLHAYLGGAGVELMGASDNVVRGGLTTKHVDVDLLLDIVDTEPLVDPILPFSDCYDLPDAGAQLLKLEAGERHVAVGHEISIDHRGASWHLQAGDTLIADDTTYVARAVS